MFQLFTTREVSTAIWIIILLIILLMSKKVRSSAINVLQISFSKQLLIPFLPVLIYSIILTFLFSRTDIWKIYYSKDIILWVLFVGIPLYYGVVQEKSLDGYFKSMVIDNLKFIAIVEFFLSIFSFSLITELILVPVITILALLDAVAGMKEEYQLVKKYTSITLSIAGLFIFYQSFEVAINNYSTLNIMDTLISFFIPFVFTILFIPISYLLALYAKYQTIFIRMGFKEKEDKRIKKWHRWLVLKACNISHKKLLYFEQNFIKSMYIGMDDYEFQKIINTFSKSTKEVIIMNKINFQIVSLILFFTIAITASINQTLSLICALLMILSFTITMFQETKNSIYKCCLFLFSTSITSIFILVLLIYIAPSLFTRINTMNDLRILIYILFYTLIQLVFFIIVTLRAEHDVARISILIIATIATLIYTIASAIVNALPLSFLNNQLILSLHMANEDISYFNNNYDGRTLINVFIQLVTYPIWCNAMIATVIGELKAYKRKNK